MSPASIAMLSISMSADAFTASLAQGASLERPRFREAVRTGLVFGLIEAITPVIGWAAGLAASAHIAAVDHWIAFALLSIIGCRMLTPKVPMPDAETAARPSRQRLSILVATAVGTSIDALAAGVALAFIDVHILVVAGAIGFATFVLATAGILLGRHISPRFGRVAEALGGLFLIGTGFTILLQHLFLS